AAAAARRERPARGARRLLRHGLHRDQGSRVRRIHEGDLAVGARAPAAARMNRTTADWQRADAAHFLHPFTDFQALAKKGSRIVTRGDGIWLWDSEGKKILDAMSGLWCVNVGYGQRALIEAATRQMGELAFYNAFFQTATPPAIELAELLSEIAPPQ